VSDDALSAGSVARRLGVAVTTLRTWHQRYGLGPTRHVKGHHRRYSREDLARLEVMRRLTAEGVSPAEAARWARGNAAPPAPAAPAGPGPGRAGGGHTIAVGTAGPAARGLARAAVRLDDRAMREIIERGLRTDGVIATWDRVVRPVLAGVGDRYAATAGFIEVEHLLSRCVSAAFASVTGPVSAAPPDDPSDRPLDGLLPAATATSRVPAATAAGRVGGGPGALLACTDEEQHTLPLEALAAALVEVGVVARLLGARVPATALVAAVDRTGPAAVVLWSHTPATADLGQLRVARSGRHRPVLVLAVGPGWPVTELPDGVRHCADLTDAVTLCRSADRAIGQQHVP